MLCFPYFDYDGSKSRDMISSPFCVVGRQLPLERSRTSLINTTEKNSERKTRHLLEKKTLCVSDAVHKMSDPEAGDSEGLENPEPEDDAHLSSLSSDAVTSPPSEPASIPQLESGSLELDHCASSGNSDPDDNCTPQYPEDGASCGCGDQEGEGTSQGAGMSEEVCSSDKQENSSDKREDLAQQEWPPESDRSDSVCDVGDTDVRNDCAEVDEASRHIQSTLSENEQGIRSVEHGTDSVPSQMSSECKDMSLSVALEPSEQQESPPEDELFPYLASTNHISNATDTESLPVQNVTVNTCTEDQQYAPAISSNSCSESDLGGNDIGRKADFSNQQMNTESMCTESDLAVSASCAEASSSDVSTDQTCSQMEICDAEGKQQSDLESPPGQADPYAIGARVEKEDDQVPECDRDPTQPGVGHTEHAGLLEVECSDQNRHAPSSHSISLSSDGQDTTNDSHSADIEQTEESGDCRSMSGASQNVNHQPDVPCDSSSDCDSKVTECTDLPSRPQKPDKGSKSVTSSLHESHLLSKPSFLEDDSEDEDLLTELDAELHLQCSPRRQQTGAVRVPVNGLKEVDASNSELCKQFEQQLLHMQETLLQREREINRLKAEKTRQREVSQEVISERNKLKAELEAMKDRNPDDLYLPQIKELEYTISQQQGEVRQLKEKLTTHDSAAKRAIATLQSEMKARIDQITKLYEDCCREKDSMVVKFAEAETKNIGIKCAEEKMEARMRDMLKEKEFTNNKMRAAMAEKQKAVAELKTKMGELGVVLKDMEKLKEDMSSAEYRIKWHQNKLKSELDSHKETKMNLEKVTAKLKEAKEETEMIRRDCQAIVKTYQESEEVRSNTLDKELKMKQTELMIKMKEHSDTEEIHQKTKHELDSLKAHHKDAMEELKTLRDKVQCLEEDRLQGEHVQAKYQTIIQNQKSDNTSLSKQLDSLQSLQEEFDRAQEMIKSLDSEVSELKLANRDLQKDIEGCQARESKMLTLQSELSRTNALLRSENTNQKNQVATLSGEVQKMSMDIQDLDTNCRNLKDELEEETKKRQQETASLSTQLETKTRESADYKQKWEDEIDASKTWKRKHASNVKDLTRQLQHAKKRLEAYESGGGGGDGTSMGSRTNSNGSLNSMDNNNQHNHHPNTAPHLANPAVRAPSQEPEFPVITEQVEVDRQRLIERIVKLQRVLARRNEKLDFLEEHIQQLVTEIKKKNRIIQGYVMREEAGTLASDVMDANKALLARKGGIMASVYSHHQQDGAMTLDLSLEINQKLQAVLEDTLLKNFTLKENLDTLGAEIARLSQENRRLQLHLQGLAGQ